MFEPDDLGYVLINSGFEPWFRYMFRVINNTPYDCEPLHKKLLDKIQDVIDGKTTRLNLNLCPRSSKTTMLIWLVVYTLTVCPKAQIIYTSFNQELLTSEAQQIASIMQNPIYQAMYGQAFSVKEEEADPIDDFWKNYLQNTEKKIIYLRDVCGLALVDIAVELDLSYGHVRNVSMKHPRCDTKHGAGLEKQ